MATLNDLFLDDDGFIACGIPQNSKEWDKLITELFKEWQAQKKIISSSSVLSDEICPYCKRVEPCVGSYPEGCFHPKGK